MSGAMKYGYVSRGRRLTSPSTSPSYNERDARVIGRYNEEHGVEAVKRIDPKSPAGMAAAFSAWRRARA